MHVNYDQLSDFAVTILAKLASPETQAAFWFYRPITLPVAVTQLESGSPFSGSGSNLAGHGVLVQLNSEAAGVLAKQFNQDGEALSALIHLEVERAGNLQFRAYDCFDIILPGPEFDSSWVADFIE